MIGRLCGELAERRPDRVMIDCAGVGYDVEIPLSTYYGIDDSAARCTLHIYTHVREDAIQLFGFASLDERETFLKLIAVNGVGPRMALAILSGIGVDDLVAAIRQQDRAPLQRVPGVGKKTAERLLLELRDKLRPRETVAAVDAPPAVSRDDVDDDAISALVNLGYSADASAKAVARVRDSEPDAPLEAVLKRALAGLMR